MPRTNNNHNNNNNNPPPRREVTPEMIAKRLGLSGQQAAVAIQMLEGKTDGAIAAALAIGETSVRKHLTRAFRKTNTSGRVQLTIRWYETMRELEREI